MKTRWLLQLDALRLVRHLLSPLVGILGLGLCVSVVSACGVSSRSAKVQSIGDGRLHLECKGALAACLQEADRLCLGNRFIVLSARDDRDYYGPSTVAESEIRTSEAVIRCGSRGRNLFSTAGAGGAAGEPTAAPTVTSAAPSAPTPATLSAPTPVPAPRVCIPGVTQTCVGPAACPGGQTCLPNGAGFGPCDCGSDPPARPH